MLFQTEHRFENTLCFSMKYILKIEFFGLAKCTRTLCSKILLETLLAILYPIYDDDCQSLLCLDCHRHLLKSELTERPIISCIYIIHEIYAKYIFTLQFLEVKNTIEN